MLKRIKGNLLDMAENGDFDVIVHGCNCQNTMGSGIAKQIRERYPEAYRADTRFCQGQDPIEKLGNYSSAPATCRHPFEAWDVFDIINAYTQVNYLPRGVDHFEYESFSLILRKLAAKYPDKRFGLPMIGMGLASGDPERIVPMIVSFAGVVAQTGGSVTLVEYDG